MTSLKKTTGNLLLLSALVAMVAFAVWKYGQNDESPGLYSGNGRIEAVEIDIATKMAGRLKDVLVREGDFVTAGQVLAVMDTEALAAQFRQAEAQLRQTRSSVATAQSQLAQRRSEKAAALAYVKQRQADLDNARNHARRSSALVAEGAISRQTAQDDESRVLGAEAALASARAQASAADAAIATAEAQVIGARSTIEAAQATVERIQADLDDSTLKSPRDGRIQYRIAHPGEVLGAGGRVLSLVDLSDVYMTFFLPTAAAGRIALGSEVRLVLDAAPLHVIPAQVSFISDVAQFTPKTVETAVEREKLMFRVRAQLPVELLKKYITQVKTGLPGMAYVLIDPHGQWPENLRVTVTP